MLWRQWKTPQNRKKKLLQLNPKFKGKILWSGRRRYRFCSSLLNSALTNEALAKAGFTWLNLIHREYLNKN
ncbi:hypothetical protein CKF58_04535 [Psittacicella hinzii]|uniref:Uncharacterized protein n=1 Tax=Psittacicella hinzii TaxID=2028575 RepID=A0A3A1YPE4_9GAMM|nr:hypothetical protein CKF58_04535 [Psittacicella hinzii]